MWAVSWIGGKLEECEWKPHQQRILVLAELEHLRETYEATTGWACVTAEEALEEIEGGSLFVFVGHRVMVLSESKPWFSAERVLVEEFIGAGIDTETAVAVMRETCRTVDIKRFTVGTRAVANGRHAGLAKLYQREGLTVSTVELMGEEHG